MTEQTAPVTLLKKWCAYWPQHPKLDYRALSKIVLCKSFP